MGKVGLLLGAGWLLIAAVTVWALTTLGLAQAPLTFASDLSHPWRAQFYADLELHLLIFAAWLLWREQWRPFGFAAAAATILLGALFTLPYLIVAAGKAGGDVRRLLLGSRSEQVR